MQFLNKVKMIFHGNTLRFQQLFLNYKIKVENTVKYNSFVQKMSFGMKIKRDRYTHRVNTHHYM